MTVHVKINGRVQGVYFRASTKEKADELKIRGWVKNMSDGSVEIVASGSDEAIKKFVSWCHQGPRGAIVSDIKVTQEAEEIKFERFVIAR